MAKIWFTSDLHFGHNREFLYKPRGFENIVDHDETIIKNWNELVAPNDEVWILGDLMLNDNAHGINCLEQLNGYKYIIIGNHDTYNRQDLYRNLDSVINLVHAERFDYYKPENNRIYHFYVSHYPTITSSMDNGAPISQHMICLCGHTHSKNKFYNEMPFIYNVALDAHNNRPVEIEEIITDIINKVNELYNSDESLRPPVNPIE